MKYDEPMNGLSTQNENWDQTIRPQTGVFDINAGELWHYRDLLVLMVRRDFVATYKQTILGPIWFFLQPILTTLTFMLIFGRIAGISTDGLPMILFYMAGVTLWNYFSECLTRTSTVFKDNASIFGKVYFPRLIMPLSIVVSNLVKLGIQLSLFLVFWLYYFLFKHAVQPNAYLLLTPLLVLMMGMQGLGFGLIITAMTNKYRDLVFLLTFGIQLAMYATPIIYPLSKIDKSAPQFSLLIRANPMSSIVETFRFGFLGQGTFTWGMLGYSAGVTLVILLFGALIFNRVEKTFMDTI
jgi:lipopolysaccharide transport system permease protein